MVTVYVYRNDLNMAFRQEVEITIQDFYKIKDDHIYKVEEEFGMISVMSPKGESIMVADVNAEQAVILFVTLMGLKEAAKEDI